MDRQEIFNKVWERAVNMVAPAYDKVRGICSYRSESGPCLVGVLISDEVYSSQLESHTADEQIILNALLLSGVDEKLIKNEPRTDFFRDLQHCHDVLEDAGSYFNGQLLKNLRTFAKNRRLKIPQ